MAASAHDELKNALDNLRKAADAVGARVLGTEVSGHLRDAARSGIRAAKAALDAAEKRMDGKAANGGGDTP